MPRDLPPIDRRLAEVETALSEALAEVAAASLLAERAGNDDALRRLAAAEKRRDKLAAEREKADRDGTERTAKQISAHPRTIAYGLAEFAERARLLCDITRVHRYRCPTPKGDRLTLKDLQSGWKSRCTPVPEDDGGALAVLYVTLNWALSAFQPLLQLVLPDGPLETPHFENALPGFQPRLFDALSLQLFNDIAAKAQYRVCGNKTCGRLFTVVPKGQRVAGEFPVAMRSSPGAKFCRDECARAQAQRAHRRRKEARKGTA